METRRYPCVYIVVVNWNQSRLTLECLRSLSAVDYRNCRIVVVDNGSTDDSVDDLHREFGGQIDLLTSKENLGFTGGNNLGIGFALERGAEYVLLLNNDTIVDRFFLTPLVDMLMLQPQIGAVTGKIYFLNEPSKIWAVGANIHWWWGPAKSRGKNDVDQGQFEQAVPVDFAPGCCLMITRTALERTGLLFDPYFMYCEDADWCLRARKLGFQIWYQPLSKIWHVAGGSSKGKTAYLYYLTTRNNFWLIKRQAPLWLKPISIVGFTIRRLLIYSIGFIILRRWEKLRGLWQGAVEGWVKQ